jgi:putative component of membrane protein insertase Oxa1/YidC/SpoIIIJ protein YidD
MAATSAAVTSERVGAGRPAVRPLLWALRALIALYRAKLSGRGPLRRVRCRFAATESCSAYGARVAELAPSAWVAARQIRGRLRRCGGACAWRWRDARGVVHIGWGEAFDERSAQGLERAWADAGETPQTRAVVGLAALARVAAHRGDGALANDAMARARALLGGAPLPTEDVLAVWDVRAGLRVMARQGWASGVVMGALIGGLACPFAGAQGAAAVAAVAALWVWVRALMRRERVMARVRRLERAAGFTMLGA